MEKAAEDLENFRSQASSRYNKLGTCRRGELKQTKETSSSVGISPDTAKADPLPKDVSHRGWTLLKVRDKF